MPDSLSDQEFCDAFAMAKQGARRAAQVGGRDVDLLYPFPSPADWRVLPNRYDDKHGEVSLKQLANHSPELRHGEMPPITAGEFAQGAILIHDHRRQ